MLNKFEKFQLKILNWVFKDSWWHIAGMAILIIAISVVMAWYATAIVILI